ncbi:hypothetical protein IID21_03250 [Patescibacteria group bacterium]|nr:hypothetical protein [Patescibacteria group bacterium]
MRNRNYSIIFVLALLLVGIVLSFVNYTPGTFLTGWDTLHPEFNFSLNFWRTFFGVWREEQGVGVVAAHSHMSELPRIFLLWLASFVFPISFLRYFYFFLTLIAGPLGVYFFLNYVLKRRNFWSSFAAFLGASYYVLNLGTLQHYYVPFEMFATQFAALPWLFLFSLKFFRLGEKRYLLTLSLISIFAAPMAYAATLFYAYLTALSAFLIFRSLLAKNKKAKLKRSFVILGIVLATNSFWLLPNLYTIFNQSEVIRSSKINRLFSPEAFLRNKEYGGLKNIALNKNFLFSWSEYGDESGEFVDLLDEWNEYIKQPKVSLFASLIALVFITGIFIAVVRRDKSAIALLIPLLISLFFLINDNPPTGPIYTYLYERNELFREGLRAPFTKFSILFMFAASFYFAYALANLFSLFSKKKWLLPGGVFLGIFSFIALVFVMKPAFEGSLISPSMRIEIPSEYSELSSWLNTQDKGRIVKLPMYTFWGWTYYDWGFEGAGFNWFDIESPTFDRDFDRWSQYNESFYKGASSALYAEDLESFEKVLEKYQVRYIFLDESVINPSGEASVTFIPETKEILSKSSRISLAKTFGFISVYETNFDFGKKFVWSPKSYSKISADLTYSQSDPIFEEYGTYVEGGTYYPFVNFDERAGMSIAREQGSVSVSQELPEKLDGVLVIPNYLEGKDPITAEIYLEESQKNSLNLKFVVSTPEIYLDGEKVAGEELSQTYILGNVSRQDLRFLQVGEEVFDLEGKSGYLGKTFVGQEDVSLKLYAKEKSSEEGFSKVLSESPRLCADPTTKIAVDTTAGEFAFKVGDKSICWGGGTFIGSDSLLVVSYESKSADNLYPNFCVTKAGREGCINKSLPDEFIQSGEWSRFIIRQPLEAVDHWIDFVGQAQDEGVAKISFRNLSFDLFPQITEFKAPLINDILASSKNEEIRIGIGTEKIEIRFKTKDEVLEQVKLGRGHAKAVNCDAVEVGLAEKKVEGERVFYSAYDGGVSCDFRDYPNLDLDKAYLLTVEGENVQGRSLKIYLQNKENKRVELEELLPNGEFSAGYVLIPKSQGNGYLLNYETRSFGKIASGNYLEAISFTPIAYNWLNSLRIKGFEAVEVKNNLAIGGVEKIGTAHYALTVASPEKEGLVVLSQGFDDGWIAYKLKTQNSKLKTFLPFLFGKKLEHVKVNSWANGWLLSQQSTVNSQSSTVIILFWPQYLQYIGMILAVGVVFRLAIKRHQKVSTPV